MRYDDDDWAGAVPAAIFVAVVLFVVGVLVGALGKGCHSRMSKKEGADDRVKGPMLVCHNQRDVYVELQERGYRLDTVRLVSTDCSEMVFIKTSENVEK